MNVKPASGIGGVVCSPGHCSPSAQLITRCSIEHCTYIIALNSVHYGTVYSIEECTVLRSVQYWAVEHVEHGTPSPTVFVNQWGMGSLGNSCIQKTSWATCFQTRPNLQYDPAVHPMQDFTFTHWFSFSVLTWVAIFISCTCGWDQLQWPSNWLHPQRGPAGGLNLPQLADNLTDHLTDHPIIRLFLWVLYCTTMCMCLHVYVLYHRQRACVPDL